MVIPGRWRGKPLTISVKPNCLTVSIGELDQADVFSFDFAGRLWTAYKDGVTYRRGLNGKILVRWRNPGEVRSRRWLSQEDGLVLEAEVHQIMGVLYVAIQTGEATLTRSLPVRGQQTFQQVLAFDQEHSLVDVAQYQRVYKPVGILPPDQYMSVVLQATEGCSFNTCTFCTFYKGRPFRIKSPADFRHHAQAVRDFLGDGLLLRRSIFLGDANSVVTPMSKLLPLLDIVQEVFPDNHLNGMYAFLDGFSGEKKSSEDYATLHEKGIQMLYIGLESGSAELLHFLRKPGTPEDAIQAVQTMKAGGIAVGVIVLLGAGGQRYAAGHVRDTIQTLRAMPLDRRDILYFSELVVDETMPYAQDAVEAGLKPLTHKEMVAQQETIVNGLKAAEGELPRISRYDIREFIY
jgi:hypothetical protein